MKIESYNPNGNKSKTGSKILNKLIAALAAGIETRINQSAVHSFDGRKDPEMPFWYNEQTTKGIITATIDDITKTNFYQEYRVNRVNYEDGKDSGSGHVDYWLEYGASTKITALVEVKQGWARVYDDEVTIYSDTSKLFTKAIIQVNSIEDKACYADLAIAMLVIPLFSLYEGSGDEANNKKAYELNSKRIEILKNAICKGLGTAKIYNISILKTNRSFNRIHKYKNEDKVKYESHPGVCLVYYVKKITRR